MTHGLEKSDFAIVAMKPANKAGAPAAEWVEPRAETKGNADPPRTRRTQSRVSVSQGLERVRQQGKRRGKSSQRCCTTSMSMRSERRFWRSSAAPHRAWMA